MRTLHWFRHDLRLSDNSALSHAASAGEVLPVFIIDTTDRALGGASKWWLNHSLKALKAELGQLLVIAGDPLELIPKLITEYDCDSVTWIRGYEPHRIATDSKLKASLTANDLSVASFAGNTLAEPWEVKTGTGGPYKVFTPFWKALVARGFERPLPKPDRIKLTAFKTDDNNGDNTIDQLLPLPENPNWAKGWDELWKPGELGAHNRLKAFLTDGIAGYQTLRDRPDLPNVSRLSPHCHFGEISPRQIIAHTSFTNEKFASITSDINKLQTQIGWRDFANHLLFHFPDIPRKNWKPAFDHYPWVENNEHLKAWQLGQTGYPIVDGGMRELWQTGYMHNRVRMVVASFLVKHLRIHWRAGEAWFWDTLLDADLPNNTASWQWVAGSGADAAPYFRIFNPYTQGQRFDPNGEYVRKWCPELAHLPNDLIHTPHEAPALLLAEAGIKLGETYPHPIVDHKQARQAALDGYEAVKQATAQ